jgi:hypothetical protein
MRCVKKCLTSLITRGDGVFSVHRMEQLVKKSHSMPKNKKRRKRRSAGKRGGKA